MRIRREFPVPAGVVAWEVEGTEEECLEFDRQLWRFRDWVDSLTPKLQTWKPNSGLPIADKVWREAANAWLLEESRALHYAADGRDSVLDQERLTRADAFETAAFALTGELKPLSCG